MHRVSLAVLLLCLSMLSAARADDSLTTFHYRDLYNIQQGVSSLQDSKRLRIGLFITSTLPGVRPEKITLTMQRASGATAGIPVDAAGRVALPSSSDLLEENPLIVTNQPKHSLKASVVIDLAPLTQMKMDYAGLMLGVEQFNDGIASNGMMASLHAVKSNGLLLFYNYGVHHLTLHEAGGDRVLKGETVAAMKAHLSGIDTRYLIPSTTVIYVPLDKNLMKTDPQIELDSLPADSTPAF